MSKRLPRPQRIPNDLPVRVWCYTCGEQWNLLFINLYTTHSTCPHCGGYTDGVDHTR